MNLQSVTLERNTISNSIHPEGECLSSSSSSVNLQRRDGGAEERDKEGGEGGKVGRVRFSQGFRVRPFRRPFASTYRRIRVAPRG